MRRAVPFDEACIHNVDEGKLHCVLDQGGTFELQAL
jgi:hypothetical protein